MKKPFDVAYGSKRDDMLYVGFLVDDELLMAVRAYALAREISFSAACRDLLEDALTRPGLRVISNRGEL